MPTPPPRRPRLTARGLDAFVGTITAAGFASGEQTVVGAWRDSPLGSFADVMWVRPDGTRVLLAPSEAVARHVCGLYAFDEVHVVPVTGRVQHGEVRLTAGPLRLHLVAGGRGLPSWLFAARPRWLRRSPAWLGLEDRLVPVLGGVLLGGADGVRIAGPTPGGRHEWYAIDDHRPLATGQLAVDGGDAGSLAALRSDIGVGLSAFPRVPAHVHLTTLIEPGPPT